LVFNLEQSTLNFQGSLNVAHLIIDTLNGINREKNESTDKLMNPGALVFIYSCIDWGMKEI